MGKRLDAAFETIAECAARGERCPQAHQIPSTVFGTLARAGKIVVRVYRHNWRVVEIMDGPHKGKQTKAAPEGGKPYMVVDANSPARRGDIPKAQKQEPWKPGDPRPAR